MCVSVAALGAMSGAISTTMTAASAIMGVIGAANEVKQQNVAYTNNIQMSNEAAIRDYDAVMSQAREANDNYARREQELMRQGWRAQGTALASSQNEGISTDLVVNDLARQIGQDITLIDANRVLQERQTQRNMEGVKANWQSRINSVAPGDNSKILAAAISGVGKLADHSLTIRQNDNKYTSNWMGYPKGSNVMDTNTAKLIGWRPGR